MNLCRRWSLALALLLSLTAAGADPADWLRAAARAERSTARVGTQLVEAWPADAAVISRVLFASDAAGHQRREHQAGPAAGLVVIDDGTWEWRRNPGSDTWQRAVALGHNAPLSEDLARIPANYTLSLMDGPAIAGQATVRLDLAPRHPGNPSRRLYLDRRTGLALRHEVWNRERELIGRTTYERLEYRAPDPATVRLPRDAPVSTAVPPGGLARVASLAELERRVGHRALQPRTLPPGYTLHDTYLRACRRVEWTPCLTYSDGLNVLTVMETGGGGGRGRHRRCVIQPSRLQVVVRTWVAGREVVVIGDLRGDLVEAMARSLE